MMKSIKKNGYNLPIYLFAVLLICFLTAGLAFGMNGETFSTGETYDSVIADNNDGNDTFQEMPNGGDNNNVADPAGEDNDSGDLADGDIGINGPDEADISGEDPADENASVVIPDDENISVEDPADENTGAVILIPDEENTSVVIPDEENINDNNPDGWFIIIDDNDADTTGDYFPILPSSDISPMALASWAWTYSTSQSSPVVDADYENDIRFRFEASTNQILQGLTASQIAQYVSLNGTNGGSFNSASGFSGGLVPAAWITSVAARNFVITIPGDKLNPSTTYEIIISKDFLDKNGDTGNSDKDYQLLFSTMAEVIDPNAISPVFANIPAKGYVGFDPDDPILISFDEAIDPNSISGSSIKLVRNFISGEGTSGQDTAVSFTLSWNEDYTLLTVKPDTALESGLVHTISVLSGLRTVSGNTIKPTQVSFTTLAFSIMEIFNDYYYRSEGAFNVDFAIKNNTTKYAKDFYGRVVVRGGQEAGEESGGDVLAEVDDLDAFGPVTVNMNATKEITVPVTFTEDEVIEDDKIYLDIYIYSDADHKYYFAKPCHGTVEVKDFREDVPWNLTVEKAVKVDDGDNNYRWDNLIDYKISNEFSFKSDSKGVFAHLSDDFVDPAALTEAKSMITLDDEVVDPEWVTFGRNEIVVTIPARQLTYSADYELKVGKELKSINNKECEPALDTVLFLTTKEREPYYPLFLNPGAKGYVGFDPNSEIIIAFDEAIDPDSIKEEMVTLKVSGEDQPLSCLQSWSDDNKCLTVKPDAALSSGVEYELTVEPGFEAVDGFDIIPDSVNFTTSAFSIQNVNVTNTTFSENKSSFDIDFAVKNNAVTEQNFTATIAVRGGTGARSLPEGGGYVLTLHQFEQEEVVTGGGTFKLPKPITISLSDTDVILDNIYVDIYIWSDDTQNYIYAEPYCQIINVSPYEGE